MRQKLDCLREGIASRDIKEFLGKSWLTHDGMWFFNVYQEYGIDASSCQ
jgi:hypothetical protein